MAKRDFRGHSFIGKNLCNRDLMSCNLLNIDLGVEFQSFPADYEAIVYTGDQFLSPSNISQTLKTDIIDITCIGVSKDSSRIALGENKNIQIWDSSLLLMLTGHSDRVTALVFSPDLLYSASSDRTIRTWNYETGQCLQTTKAHGYPINCLAFTEQRYLLASAGFSKNVKLWDIHTMNWVHLLQGHTDHIDVLCFSSDGEWIASGSKDCSVRIWHISSEKLFSIVRDIHTRIYSISFYDSDKYIVIGAKNYIYFRDIRTNFTTQMYPGNSFAISSDNKYLVSSFKIWKLGFPNKPNMENISAIDIYDINIFVAWRHDTVVKVWKDGNIVNIFPGHKGALSDIFTEEVPGSYDIIAEFVNLFSSAKSRREINFMASHMFTL